MRAVVAMSGGVDSSVAAALLQQQGYEVIGITMNVWDYDRDPCASATAKSCCSPKDVNDARRVCEQLGIPFYPMNYREDFKNLVVNPFIDAYVHGRTPNPCVLCNDLLKFDKLYKQAKILDADVLATGHYARIVEKNNKFLLLRGVDRGKDQSYFLFGLKRPALEMVRFPLGELSKEQTRELAGQFGLRTENKRESQDVCFVANGSYADLVQTDPRLKDVNTGDIVDLSGKVLGKHNGFYRYTIGQRRGLGVAAAERLYVIGIDPEQNRVIVGSEEETYQSELVLDGLSLVDHSTLQPERKIVCQIRSRHAGAPAKLMSIDDETIRPGGRAKVIFDEPQSAITPGQAAVFYDGDEVLGGGWIAGGTS